MRNDNTLNVKIYDHFYGYLAVKERVNLDNATKVNIIEQIFADMTWDMSTAIRAYVRYQSLEMAKKNTGLDKKAIRKQVNLGTRWMYFPNNIRLAIPGFYDVAGEKTGNSKLTMLTLRDFEEKKYILTALKKSGIVTKEQLYKHLSLGWYYLWTIPGCGDCARLTILKAIDKWEGRKVFKVYE